MKTFIYTLFMLLSIYSTQAQNLSGYWLGTLSVQGQSMRIAFNITKTGDTYTTTMDSPDQKAKGIPTSTISMTPENIKVSIAQMGVTFTGTLKNGQIIKGTFSQGGLNLPLALTKQEVSTTENQRPQHPQKPYPYHSEDVKFKNKKADISLAGTFTKPKDGKNLPAIILISGSGPQNRDEELMQHKPFLVLADYFTKRGYAVLRYDDRGTFESEGDFKTATSKDFATDTEAAIEYLKNRTDINPAKIGLMGHSEGGLIAPMVASENTDVAFIVLLAGTGVSGYEVILDQIEAINRANGETEKTITDANYMTKSIFGYLESIQFKQNRKALISDYLTRELDNNPKFSVPENITKEQFIQSQLPQLSSPWMNYFLFYNPQIALSKVTCPVLAINGDKDLQVTSRLNIPKIEQALKRGKTNTYKTMVIPGLNHLFQECTTGSPNEYENITQTFSPKALIAISDWMEQQNLN